MATEAAAGYRELYRREYIPPHYRGWRHLAFTFGIGELGGSVVDIPSDVMHADR